MEEPIKKYLVVCDSQEVGGMFVVFVVEAHSKTDLGFKAIGHRPSAPKFDSVEDAKKLIASLPERGHEYSIRDAATLDVIEVIKH